MKPKSRTLFHFTKNQEVVKNILETGFWPKFCLEDLRWYNQNMSYLALPIVSFCDIPLSRIDEHVDFYGDYGIGVSKEWAIKNGLNPVMYISSSSTVTSSMIDLSYAEDKYEDDDEKKKAHMDFTNILAHTKPIEGKMSIGDSIVEKEFYQENEWRFFAQPEEIDAWLIHEGYEDETTRNNYNQITREKHSLKVSPQDIKYIFVKSDVNIPDMINFIQTKLDHFSGADQKILMSRVISLESIKHDI